MSIKNKGLFDFSNTLGLTRVFKMSLGFRDFKNRKGAPRSLDRFLPEWKRKDNLDPKLSDNARKNIISKCDLLENRYKQHLVEAYGTDEPNSLDVVFLTDNLEQILPYNLKMYDGQGVLLCKGNAAIYNRPEEITDLTLKEYNLDENDYGEIIRGEKPQYKDMVCKGEHCPMYQQKKCQIVGNLLFTDINIKPLSVIQIDTGSPTSIKNVIQTIRTVQTQHGTVVGIPFKLYVDREEVRPTVNGKKIKTLVSFIKLAPDFSIKEFRQNEIDALTNKQVELNVAENDIDAYDDGVGLVTDSVPDVKEIGCDEESCDDKLKEVIKAGAALGYSEGKVKYELKNHYSGDIKKQIEDYRKKANNTSESLFEG